MNRLILTIAIILTVYITGVFAFDEFSFKDQGYQDFYINGFDALDCTSFDFVYPKDLNAFVFPVVSLKADFAPLAGKDSKIIIYFNDDNVLLELRPTDFKDGIARVWLPQEKVMENNSFKVCGKTSFSVNKIRIGADSTFGVYETSYFPPENGFKLELETYRPIIGVPFRIDAVARNYGSRDVVVTLTYRKSELEENTPEISVLSGETTNSSVVPKCLVRDANTSCTKPGEYRITYMVVANRAVPMTLLPAVMTFQNIFGEDERILANRPSLEALEPEHTISAQIFLENDKLFTNDSFPIRISVRNKGTEPVMGAVVAIDTGLEVPGSESEQINLEAGQSRDIVFTARGTADGEYLVGCSVQYNSKELECVQTTINLEKNALSGEIIFSALFLLIALSVFGYFHFKKA